MKKISCILVLIFLMSCGSQKEIRQSEKTLKGNWYMEDVSASAIGDLKFTIFGKSSKDCLIGSSWEFIPNNNTGSYVESGMGCSDDQNYFAFNIDSVSEYSGLYDFLLKPTNEKGKSETDTGYRLELISLTKTTMAWKHTVSFEGKPLTLTFKFIKQ